MDLLDIDPTEITHYNKNPRVNDHAVADMAELISTHGFRVPVLVVWDEENEQWLLVDGHLRIKAAISLQLETVPALDVSDMNEDQIASFRISVNRAAEFADWDVPLLLEELQRIDLPEEDMPTIVGMDDDYLSALTEEPAPVVSEQTAPQAAREKQADPTRVRSDEDTVSLSFSMKLKDRTRVLERLEQLKTQHGKTSLSAALITALLPAEAPKTRKRKKSKK
jgi:ParB-like chromosome segregation protein Spo0J